MIEHLLGMKVYVLAHKTHVIALQRLPFCHKARIMMHLIFLGVRESERADIILPSPLPLARKKDHFAWSKEPTGLPPRKLPQLPPNKISNLNSAVYI